MVSPRAKASQAIEAAPARAIATQTIAETTFDMCAISPGSRRCGKMLARQERINPSGGEWLASVGHIPQFSLDALLDHAVGDPRPVVWRRYAAQHGASA